MQRKQALYVLAVLALLVSMLPVAAVAQEASPPAPNGIAIEEFAAPDDKSEARPDGFQAPLFSPDGMSFFNETEPNDTPATANALPGSQVAVLGNISPATEVDFFSFTANTGDRVYAATQTQWSNGGSTDTVLDIYASDGTTVLETDDESGSFSASSSAIGGTIIPADGTYYIRVDGFSSSSTITPYFLHVRVQSGTPTAEVEPNNDLATATPLAASQWMSGTITATTDPDLFSFTLNAGDSVYLGLDMDPGRLPSNTNWNGRLGLGVLNNFFLLANDSSTTKPHAEAFFMTVQEAGTYYAYVDSTSATGLGANARYNLSVSIYPKQVQNNCTVFTSTDVPKTIGPGVGTSTSTIVVPPTVTSSIQDINATIVLTHSLMADLDVTLVGPTAASTPLFTDIGSGTAGVNIQMNVGLDDQAALPIGTFTVVSGMVNQPEQPGRLGIFNGTPAGGTWTLQLADDLTNTSGGRLQSWSLEVCGDPPPPYAIELNKTVGTEPGQCAIGDTITVPAGGATVYYCYTVRNTGLNTLTTHDLVDSELGALLTGVSYSLAPGATYSFIQQATVDTTVTNTATWTATDGTGTASDSDTATVNVAAPLCPAGFNDVILDAAAFDTGFPPADWTVTDTSSGCLAPGVPQWTNSNPGGRTNLTGGAGPFAIADSDRCGSGSTLDTIMSTGLLDFSGLISPTVRFNTDYDDLSVGGVNDQALLDVSTDGGATWANLFTWDSDHRGPLQVTQALPGAAGDNDVQVRWHYAQGTWDWWWQVDDAFITACEPIPAAPAISLDKTVGTDPNVCATTDEITLPYGGGSVTYCYEVTNTGDVSFNTHDLDDSELGSLLSGFSYLLAPGASAFITESTYINFTTVNTATWTAYNQFDGGPPPAEASDVATVTVGLPDPAIVLTKTVGTDPNVCATTDDITVPANTDVTYCYTVENTGNVPFTDHNLNDSELGALLTNEFIYLAPGDTAFVTETANIAVTTVNTATWYAEYIPKEGFINAQATDTATVTVESLVPAIVLTKTVGLDPNTCAATDDITVPAGTDVTYCYTVENTGGVTLNLHDLDDSELGNIFTGLSYALAPGASVFVTETANIAVTTVNTGTWTAYNSGALEVCSTPNVAIPDTNPTGVSDTLDSTTGGIISDLDVFINTTHTWVGDLIYTLEHVSTGTTVTLIDRPGRTTTGVGCSGNNIDNTVDDEAVQSFENNCTSGTNPTQAYVAGQHYQGGDPASSTLMTAFDGEDLGGDWTMTVSDNAAGDTGTLNEWCLVTSGSGESVSASDVATVTVQGEPPNIFVDPLSVEAKVGLGQTTTRTLTISNTGDALLDWVIDEEPTSIVAAGNSAQPPLRGVTPANKTPGAEAAAIGSRGGTAGAGAPIVYDSPADFSEGFDDITLLPGQGWFFQNNSSPLGLTDWFQGNDTVFPAHAGAPTAYIGANFNNTSGVGTISNWMLTPMLNLNNGDTISFWTRSPDGSIWPDRVELRLSTAGASTNVGTLATDVGDFTTLLLSVNPGLAQGGYPSVWTQFSATLAGLPPNATGRIAWRYFVTNAGPSGSNSDYIGIDTVEYTAAATESCTALADIPWLTVTPANGSTAAGGATPVELGFDGTSLAAGIYTGNLCISSNDPDAGPGNETELVIVPITLEVNPPTAVALTDLAAGEAASPAPLGGLPLAGLPAAAAAALGAAFVWRRKRT